MMTSHLYQAYLDEGGTHDGASILTVGGFYGTREQWNVFLNNWKHPEFHACDSRFDSLKPQLADAIDLAEIEGVEVCLRPHEFKAMANADLKSTTGNAYAVAAFICATGICRILSTNPDARVSFVLEDGQPNIRWLERASC